MSENSFSVQSITRLYNFTIVAPWSCITCVLRSKGLYIYTRCMEATPSLACANKCVFCWRHHTNPVGKSWRWKMDDPLEIVNTAIDLHKKMIKQMKGVPGILLVLCLFTSALYLNASMMECSKLGCIT